MFLRWFFKIFLICLLIVITASVAVQAVDVSGEHIKNFNSMININRNGTISVAEKIVYDFDKESRHGITREIPYVKKNSNGREFILKYGLKSVTDEKGTPYNYQVSNTNNNFNIKIGDPDKTTSGLHTYVIKYDVSGALTYFSDHDELSWIVNGFTWKVPVLSSSAEIDLPGEIDKTVCYTGIYGSREKNCSTSLEGQAAYFKTNNILNPGSGLTVIVSFPKNIVAVLEPAPADSFSKIFNSSNSNDKNSQIIGWIIAYGILGLILLWYVIYPLWLPIKWFIYGRDPKTLGPVRAWFDPPKDKSGRFLTPEETGTLLDEKADDRDVFAMIVYLAQKGYLKILQKKKNDFYFKKVKEYDNDVSLFAHEKYLLKKLFNKSDEFRLKDHQIYETVEKIKRDVYTKLVTNGYFPSDPNATRKFYQVIFGLALGTLNLPLAFTAKIYGSRMPKKTLFGAQSAKVGQSLKNFLSSQERQLNFQGEKQMLFEKLLPYAIAFGVEKNWARRFQDLTILPPVWYESYDSANFNSFIFAQNLSHGYSNFHTLSSPPTATSSTSGFSSGFSSGGGFSGSGGGGGGGGSW